MNIKIEISTENHINNEINSIFNLNIIFILISLRLFVWQAFHTYSIHFIQYFFILFSNCKNIASVRKAYLVFLGLSKYMNFIAASFSNRKYVQWLIIYLIGSECIRDILLFSLSWTFIYNALRNVEKIYFIENV